MFYHKILQTKQSRAKVKKLLFKINREWTVRRLFKNFLGRELNLDNPQTYNDKMQWLKLYWYDPNMKDCVDKYKVREYIAEKGYGHTLNELYGVYDKAEDIDFDKLPDSFILKANHGCRMNIIVNDKSELDREKAVRQLNEWLAEDFYWRNTDWVYKGIEPKIVCEKNLSNDKGEVPEDYKIFCFEGEPRVIAVDVDRYGDHYRNLYDSKWNYIEGRINYKYKKEKQVPKPELLEEMVEMARILSADFLHVRVDVYELEGKLIFGELTFFNGSGFTRQEPPEFERYLGNFLPLPEPREQK